MLRVWMGLRGRCGCAPSLLQLLVCTPPQPAQLLRKQQPLLWHSAQLLRKQPLLL
jgi:hypothetical protein